MTNKEKIIEEISKIKSDKLIYDYLFDNNIIRSGVPDCKIYTAIKKIYMPDFENILHTEFCRFAPNELFFTFIYPYFFWSSELCNLIVTIPEKIDNEAQLEKISDAVEVYKKYCKPSIYYSRLVRLINKALKVNRESTNISYKADTYQSLYYAVHAIMDPSRSTYWYIKPEVINLKNNLFKNETSK